MRAEHIAGKCATMIHITPCVRRALKYLTYFQRRGSDFFGGTEPFSLLWTHPLVSSFLTQSWHLVRPQQKWCSRRPVIVDSSSALGKYLHASKDTKGMVDEATVTTVPCRTCMCANCCLKVDRCPLCRSNCVIRAQSTECLESKV